MPQVMRLNKMAPSQWRSWVNPRAIAQFMQAQGEIWGFPGWNAEAVTDAAKVLKYLPMDKAQDARNFINSPYWLGTSRKPGKLPADAGRYVPP